jgi:hypothetical protein
MAPQLSLGGEDSASLIRRATSSGIVCNESIVGSRCTVVALVSSIVTPTGG